ncbi:serine carboxypeptidase [Peniophora sp. CONT]|nr:serine carboxypeptidase [Peniophora sp. CONT]
MSDAGLSLLYFFLLFWGFATVSARRSGDIILESLSTVTYTTLFQSTFPNHSVRIKRTTICESEIAYTGYIDIGAKHLFFYFFESRGASNDTLYFTNGGEFNSPGGSSSIGLFFEFGPCLIRDGDEGPTRNPLSWSERTNLLFVDQPVGTGFSYAEHGEYVDTTPQAAEDIAAFLAIFFNSVTSLRGGKLHVAGESFGGRFAPLIAAAVYDQNTLFQKNGNMAPFDLASVIIANGATDLVATYVYAYETLCTDILYGLPIKMDISYGIYTCSRMQKAAPRCMEWATATCIDTFDPLDCEAAQRFCVSELFDPFQTLGYSDYDMAKRCPSNDPEAPPCYPELFSIQTHLNRTDVKEALGVDTDFVPSYTPVALGISAAFHASGDAYKDSVDYVAALLERGVRVLVYTGEHDLLCNWPSGDAWTRNLDWTGRSEFNAVPLRDWKMDDTVAGLARVTDKFAFATIRGAGHMAPHDKPKESLELISRWLAGTSIVQINIDT